MTVKPFACITLLLTIQFFLWQKQLLLITFSHFLFLQKFRYSLIFFAIASINPERRTGSSVMSGEHNMFCLGLCIFFGRLFQVMGPPFNLI